MEEISGWLTEHEGIFLEKATASLRKTQGAIVEIGSYLGKSTVHLARGREIVYAIDPHKGIFSGGSTGSTKKQFLVNLDSAGVKAFVKPIIKTSKEASKAWTKPIKFVFIDGLHDKNHALEDFHLWSPYLVSGGIVAMHDSFCGWEGAGAVAMRHIVYGDEFGEIGVVGSIIYGVKKNIGLFGWIQKEFRQCIIELCQSIYRSPYISKRVQFILVHKLLRVFLINRFSVIGRPSGKNAIWQ